MSSNMGKEKTMGESSYRKYQQAAAQSNMSVFPLTSLKEENLAPINHQLQVTRQQSLKFA